MSKLVVVEVVRVATEFAYTCKVRFGALLVTFSDLCALYLQTRRTSQHRESTVEMQLTEGSAHRPLATLSSTPINKRVL